MSTMTTFPKTELPQVFRYKSWRLEKFLMMSFLLMQIALAVYGYLRGELLMTVLFGFFSLFSLFGISVSYLGQADIRVNSDGISKHLYGKVWRKIAWNNVNSIVTFSVRETRRRTIECFCVYPNETAGKILKKGVEFSEDIQGIEELLNVVNYYAIEHGIRIEKLEGGKREIMPSLKL